MDDILFLLEIIGTICFALSGVLVAIEYGLDYFGVIVLGVVTSTGGGIIRDLLIGRVPPVALADPIYCTVAIITGIVAMLLYKFASMHLNSNMKSVLITFITIFDAIGLGIFTVVSVDSAIKYVPNASMFLVTFVAVITGVGGGIIRDLLVNRKPVVLRKQIYALACLAGALIYYFMIKTNISHEVSLIGCIIFIVIIRLIAARARLNLPNFEDIKNAKK